MRERRPTSTSNFGVGRRESHDATAFYERFQPPELSADDEVQPPKPVADPFVCGDARAMDEEHRQCGQHKPKCSLRKSSYPLIVPGVSP